MLQASAIFIFGVSLLMGLVIALGRHVFPALTRRGDDDTRSVQAAHQRITPRLGGVGIMAALGIGTLIWFSSVDIRVNYAYFLATILPLFVVGLMEDLGYRASPARRLTTAAISGVLFVVVFQTWLPRIDIPIVDLAFAWAPAAIPLTIFICVGVTHAFNLIDGVNGLCASIAIFSALSLSFIADAAGLHGHRDALWLLTIAIFGFLVLNFPFGMIFLGDAGAYLLGHVLVWTAVSMLWLSPDISAFSILLIFFWPIADTLLAIWRRARNGKKLSSPDRLHFHQLVMRAIEISFVGKTQRTLSNPLTSIIIIPAALAPMGVAVLYWDSLSITFMASCSFGAAFFAAYVVGIRWSKRSRRLISGR